MNNGISQEAPDPMSQSIHYYQINDIARISSPACEGCGECCRGMGDTIVLDPYDAYQLAIGLNKPFADLMSKEIALHNENSLLLPHIAMQGSQNACSFLSEDCRCGIHSFRPGICRLYPRSRKYTDEGIRYFIPEEVCAGHSLIKKRIRSYLDIRDYHAYESYKCDWFRFLKDAEDAAISTADSSLRTKTALFVLETFFLRPYACGDFYALVEKRMKRARRFLGLL